MLRQLRALVKQDRGLVMAVLHIFDIVLNVLTAPRSPKILKVSNTLPPVVLNGPLGDWLLLQVALVAWAVVDSCSHCCCCVDGL